MADIEDTIIDWQVAAPDLSIATDPDTVGLRRLTSNFLNGPWFESAVDAGWSGLEMFGLGNENGSMGLVPLMHFHTVPLIIGINKRGANLIGGQTIQRLTLPTTGEFWWRHPRFSRPQLHA